MPQLPRHCLPSVPSSSHPAPPPPPPLLGPSLYLLGNRRQLGPQHTQHMLNTYLSGRPQGRGSGCSCFSEDQTQKTAAPGPLQGSHFPQSFRLCYSLHQERPSTSFPQNLSSTPSSPAHLWPRYDSARLLRVSQGEPFGWSRCSKNE